MRWIGFSCVALGLLPGTVRGEALAQGVYVWQRDQGNAVRDAIEQAAPRVESFDVLAAEVGRPSDGSGVTWVKPAAHALVASGRPIGLVLRVGPASVGGRGDSDYLVSLAREVLQRGRNNGISPFELQIDFDCAESGLGDYVTWLARIHAAVRPVPVIFTALPSWLHHTATFAALAQASDGFVLQVHSLDRPKGPDDPFTLCDPAKARAWVRQASAFGRPFRVALPTYGYAIAFDGQGRFIGLSADGPQAYWEKAKTVRRVEADPDGLAALVMEWRKTPPAHCTGLLWFRLPVETDLLTWAQPTWEAVMAGRMPRSDLQVTVNAPRSGLVEVALRNDGERFESPRSVIVTWPENVNPLGVDAFGGFRLESRGPRNEVQLIAENSAEGERIAPGKSRTIAWIRFSHDFPVDARVAPQP